MILNTVYNTVSSLNVKQGKVHWNVTHSKTMYLKRARIVTN